MARKEADRHNGMRVELYFPANEYSDMLKAMGIAHEPNRSKFIRTSVHNMCKAVKEMKEKGAL